MTRVAAYPDLYPRSGHVALLCEGDLAGYETTVLRKWIDARLASRPLVDIWPCGTSQALFGLSDAIGRSRPLLVIEDRDFRSSAQAEKECRGIQKNRRGRAVKVVEWRCWERNEIENYLLDEPVLLPVMSEWFACAEDEVRDAVSQVIDGLAVFQAAEYALYHALKEWSRSDPTSLLRNDLRHRPGFSDTDRRPFSADGDAVYANLKRNISQWRQRVVADGEVKEPFSGELLLTRFQEKRDAWSPMSYDDPAWRIEWSGKEVLQGLRMVLTARKGWPDVDTGHRQPLLWEGLSRSRRDEQDRPLEKEMQPDLVDRAVEYLNALTEGELFEEWSAIESAIRNWKSAVA